MNIEELSINVQVLEERIARLAGALLVLLEAIDQETEKQAAREIWEALQDDLDPKQ